MIQMHRITKLHIKITTFGAAETIFAPSPTIFQDILQYVINMQTYYTKIKKYAIRRSYISIIHNKDTFQLRNAEPPRARHNSPYIDEFSTSLFLDYFFKNTAKNAVVSIAKRHDPTFKMEEGLKH